MFVDCHCHIDSMQDPAGVIQRAEDAGVCLMVNNGIGPKSNKASLKLAARHKSVKAALGLHPSDWLCKENPSDATIAKEIEFIRNHKKEIVAIGEVGLDYYWVKDEAQRARQRDLFRRMILLAEELKKPLIVHSRLAEKDCFSILQNRKVPVVMHCFTALEQIQLGFYYSIPAKVITSLSFQELAKKVRLSHMLTETDCPLLSPYTGRQNEPSFMPAAIQAIAQVRGLDPKETEMAIFSNCQKLFLMS